MPVPSFLRWLDRNGSSSSSFSLSRGLAVVETPAFPIAKVPERLVDERTLREYEESAKSMGYSVKGLVQMQLLDFLVAHSIPIFDFNTSYRWLSHYPRNRTNAKYWGWFVLGNRTNASRWNYNCDGPTGNGYGYGYSQYRTGLVPKPVLDRASKLKDRFGDAIEIYVSCRGIKEDRHFVMAVIKDQQPSEETCCIFDAWDDATCSLTSRGDIHEGDLSTQ
ncbi:MAG: hypothetical protein UZ21_OP11001000327 [Microgenomates bacterium OLB22]|nr:MAG: hypothetical protein UZ21_OP11001000327 [Microgenomates bacterium OLB22]